MGNIWTWFDLNKYVRKRVKKISVLTPVDRAQALYKLRDEANRIALELGVITFLRPVNQALVDCYNEAFVNWSDEDFSKIKEMEKLWTASKSPSGKHHREEAGKQNTEVTAPGDSIRAGAIF